MRRESLIVRPLRRATEAVNHVRSSSGMPTNTAHPPGLAAATREPVRSGDVRSDPRYIQGSDAIRSELAVPLIFNGQVIGVLDIQSAQLDYFSPELQEIIYRALEREPARRYSKASDFARDLENPGQVTVLNRAELTTWSWHRQPLPKRIAFYGAVAAIPVAIFGFGGIHEIPWGEISAGSELVTLPIIALVLIFQRLIVQGLTAGALKG